MSHPLFSGLWIVGSMFVVFVTIIGVSILLAKRYRRPGVQKYKYVEDVEREIEEKDSK